MGEIKSSEGCLWHLVKNRKKRKKIEQEEPKLCSEVSGFRPGGANLNSAKPLPLESTAHLTCHGPGKCKGARSHLLSK